MRIGIITGEYPPMQGGVGDFTRELATALADLGHAVHVITRVGCVGQSTASRVTVHPIVPRWDWRSYGTVLGLARRLQLDVLDVQYQAAAYDLHPAINFLPWRLNLPLVKRARPTVVVTFHDLKVPYLFPKAGPLRDWVVTLLARHADAAIVTNRADELSLTARRVGQIARIPIGSNIAPVLPADYERDAWRARLGLTPTDFVVGFFGFFNARKGIETLVRALAALCSAESLHYHLLFIGGTVGSSDATNRAYADRVIALIAELGLGERVHYTGYVPAPQVSAAFAATDLCALPYADGVSFHHGSLMAALAHGQPIVSTRPQVELPELVHGENVWLVPPEDPDALGAALTTLAADLQRRQRLAQGAAELAAQFSWPSIAERTCDLFGKLEREI
jgi:glycosyltransferase involved in cell wall biosynthesis